MNTKQDIPLGLTLAEIFGVSTHELVSFTVHVDRNPFVTVEALYKKRVDDSLQERLVRLRLVPQKDTDEPVDQESGRG